MPQNGTARRKEKKRRRKKLVSWQLKRQAADSAQAPSPRKGSAAKAAN